MAITPEQWIECPACHQRSGLRLEMVTSVPAKYFECDACGHIWKVPIPPEPTKKKKARH